MFERVAAPDYKLTEEKIQIFMRQIIKGNRYPDVLTFSFSYSDHIKLIRYVLSLLISKRLL